MTFRLTDSPHLVHVPPIDPSHALNVGPSSFENWDQMFGTDGILDFLLGPHDYRMLGPLVFPNGLGGTKDRPKTVRYHEPGAAFEHVVRRSGQALVDCLRFEKPGTANWLVQGLTVTEPSKASTIQAGARQVTVDGCLIDRPGMYAIRIRDANDCTIQRCVIRDSRPAPDGEGGFHDTVGIYVGNTRYPASGIQILDNEIYNVGDGIQTNDYVDAPFTDVAVTIDGNDLYLQPSRYIEGTNTTWDENAIDLKAGASEPESTWIKHNRMWGYRIGADPPGPECAFVFRRAARDPALRAQCSDRAQHHGRCAARYEGRGLEAGPTGRAAQHRAVPEPVL